MKALVAAPDADGHIDLVDVEEPEPRPSHVVVDVKAVSLNRGEVQALQGAEAGWGRAWDVAGLGGMPAPDGTVVSFGNSSGEPTTFDPPAFYRKPGARLYAFVIFPELRRSRTATTDLRYLANLVAAGHLDVGLDRVVDWGDLGAVRAAV